MINWNNQHIPVLEDISCFLDFFYKSISRWKPENLSGFKYLIQFSGSMQEMSSMLCCDDNVMDRELYMDTNVDN